MASVGKKLEDEKLVSYILGGLGVKRISLGELYTQLVSFEQQMEIHGGGGQ